MGHILSKTFPCKGILNANLVLVNLGKWILRYLFDKLIAEESRRDAAFRKKLTADTSRPNSLQRANAPESIQITHDRIQDPQELMNGNDSSVTPRPTTEGLIHAATTPGLVIGTGTPTTNGVISNTEENSNVSEEATSLEKRESQNSQSRASMDPKSEYFSTGGQTRSPIDGQPKGAITSGDTALDATSAQLPNEGDKDEKGKEGGLFGKSFRMKFPKRMGRPSTDVKPAVVDEKSEESDKSEDKEDRTLQDNFYGAIQKIRFLYEEQLHHSPSSHLSSGIVPSAPFETPELHLPPYTTVIIQDERPDTGGVVDLYRGTVSSVGYDADIIEKVAPMWLGELTLKVNTIMFSCHMI